jgi:CHAT domain-containing protein
MVVDQKSREFGWSGASQITQRAQIMWIAWSTWAVRAWGMFLLAAVLFPLPVAAGLRNGQRQVAALAEPPALVLGYVLDEELLTITLHRHEKRTRPGRPTRLTELRRIEIPGGRRVLASLVAGFHRMVAQRDPAYPQLGRVLFDTLIKPVAEDLGGCRLLCLIPDNILWDVPFQALVAPDGRHLLELFPLYYAPSLAQFADLSTIRNGRAGPGSLLSIGNPEPGESRLARLRRIDRQSRFAPLPEAELEARIVSRLHGMHLSQVLIGREATEGAVKRLAPGRHILHFATHGVLDDRNPLRSYLLLADSESEPAEDGLLEAREIMELDLQAELAILSACETARGWIGGGQGLIGLSGAFLRAGCRTVVVTQWKVDSRRTAELVVNFYQWLKSGPTGKAEALTRAAREMMRHPPTRHPHFWAAMIIVGTNQ